MSYHYRLGSRGPYPEVDGGVTAGVIACSKLPCPSRGCSIYKIYIFLWHRGGGGGGVTDTPAHGPGVQDQICQNVVIVKMGQK